MARKKLAMLSPNVQALMRKRALSVHKKFYLLYSLPMKIGLPTNFVNIILILQIIWNTLTIFSNKCKHGPFCNLYMNIEFNVNICVLLHRVVLNNLMLLNSKT